MNASSPHLVLIGMMGVGKTTVGRLLAQRLGWEFWDNDVALRLTTGRTAAEVQRSKGQAGLHRLENRLLGEALATETPTVFAASASVVLDPDLLRDEVTVWLRASWATEVAHLAASGQHHRPLPPASEHVLRHLAAERDPLYARLADITVRVAADADSTCERVLAALRVRGHIQVRMH